MGDYQYGAENIGNIVALEHVNTAIDDQQLATTFYVSGLGLTRDPYLNTGTGNMWVNVGRSQFHLPTRPPQRLRGTTAIVLPGRGKLLERLEGVAAALAGTQFSFEERNDYVAATCPWGNAIRIYEPGAEFGSMQLGMPYVEFDVASGSAAGIAKFYETFLATPASVSEDGGVPVARAFAGEGQVLAFKESDVTHPEFDGHHVAIYVADFSGPYERLAERGLISQEDNQHQYRFIDIIDPDDGRVLFQIEHEVRSMRHPLYARPLINRDPTVSVMGFRQGHEDLAWTTASPG